MALAVELDNKAFFGNKSFSMSLRVLTLQDIVLTNITDDLPAEQQVKYIMDRLDYLKTSRPTAVDLGNAIKLLKKSVRDELHKSSDPQIKEVYQSTATKIFIDDYGTNLAIGRYGAEYIRSHQPPIPKPLGSPDDPDFFTTSPPGTQGANYLTYRKLSVLTHCNTGSLATSGHGTALGIIRSLYKMNYLDHAYCTETRPYNQGSRLTAYELVYENIPATLITDSMAGALFSRLKIEKNIAAVVVGADRVARNGDTANKIGTYSLAVLAKYHGIKFIVAAPTTTIDFETLSGSYIKIEERAHTEMTQISGATVREDGTVDVGSIARVAIAHQEINVWNPSFDVTPSELIDAIITEKGEVEKNKKGQFEFWKVLPSRWEAEVCPLDQDGLPVNGFSNGNHGKQKGSDESEDSKKSSGTETSKATKVSDDSFLFKMEDLH